MPEEPTPLIWTLEEDLKTQADGDGGREGPLKCLRCRADIDHWQATSKGPGYEHDSRPTFGPLNPTAHFYREFTAYLDNPFFHIAGGFSFRSLFFFLSFTVHLQCRNSPRSFPGLLIYVGLAFLWESDFPHGSNWYQLLWFLRSSKGIFGRNPWRHNLFICPDIY